MSTFMVKLLQQHPFFNIVPSSLVSEIAICQMTMSNVNLDIFLMHSLNVFISIGFWEQVVFAYMSKLFNGDF